MDLKQIRTGRWGAGRLGSVVLAGVLAAVAGTFVVQARTPQDLPGSVVASVAYAGLPVQGREVMAQIQRGGPFRYEKDGTVFGNRERLLPGQQRGYYREYTVPTPGLSHRGARRIVCGGQRPRAPDACYYTEDHYSSFRLIVR
ncbi:guanine-specific ribonuclease N1 and T1 [Hydrogenophaga taeniospiralis CCUG 15921]|uniref:Guanine-specific ribonuclease N1 and T1 n=1 Tax=Hydrogenophaga taeniospiralis CCUG 15921 TaxID=1281780 RepID=A0A9X4NWM4_9BURK|nr:ribonuclease domain-containing protein [Hydrogenophaga taeniospiralis]MDG5975840.1 guanine-specific ribonuclease N1 and T1 [Hydrogenophaga taeniospiralis CCUG 15921]